MNQDDFINGLIAGPLVLSQSAPDAERTIDPSWILIASVNQIPVRLENAIINGRILSTSGTFTNPWSFRGCSFEKIQLDYSRFDQLVEFDECHFRDDVDFHGATFAKDLRFEHARFDGIVELSDIRVEISICGDGSTFSKTLNLSEAVIKSSIYLEGATFGELAEFDGSEIGRELNLSHATFKSDAHFGGALIKDLCNVDQARFMGSAKFPDLHVDVAFDATTSTFEGPFSLNGAKFAGDLVLNSASFLDEVDLIGIVLSGQLQLTGAHIKGEADLTATSIGGDAFLEATIFESLAKFSRIKVNGTLDLSDAKFGATLILRDADVGSLEFSNTHLDAVSIDLRGCRYSDLRANWRQMLAKLAPFDRQPFQQLEETYRRSGAVERADDVYYYRRTQEAKMIWAEPTDQEPLTYAATLPLRCMRSLGDWFLRWSVGYGVRPVRSLLSVLFMPFIAGLILFASGNTILTSQNVCEPATFGEALWIAIKGYVPFDLQTPRHLIPSDCRTILGISTSGTLAILRVIGWVVIPTVVGSLTGVLRYASSRQ